MSRFRKFFRQRYNYTIDPYKRYADFNDKFYNEVKTRLESKFGDRIKLFYCVHPGICCVNALARSKKL